MQNFVLSGTPSQVSAILKLKIANRKAGDSCPYNGSISMCQVNRELCPGVACQCAHPAKPSRFCLSCGVDRQELASMLCEPEVLEDNGYGGHTIITSENRNIAVRLINGCPVCKAAFTELSNKLEASNGN
jgi:hypothetical protein